MAPNLNYTQLLFAAEVRKLAVEMWTFERKKVASASTVTPEKIEAWDAEHAFSTYIPLALNQILRVAVHIQETEDMPLPEAPGTPSA